MPCLFKYSTFSHVENVAPKTYILASSNMPLPSETLLIQLPPVTTTMQFRLKHFFLLEYTGLEHESVLEVDC